MTELEKQWAELQAKIEWLMNYVSVLQADYDQLVTKYSQLVTKCNQFIKNYEEPKCQN